MRKLTLSLLGMVTIFLTLLFSTLSASAYETHYEDIGDDYCWVYYEPDFANGTATVTGYYPTDNGEVAIPETVYCWDDEDNYRKLSVVSISEKISCLYVDYIRIPATVQSIGQFGVGYESVYDYDTGESFYRKKSNFTIGCLQGTYAENYASYNGFNISLLKDINSLSTTLSSSTFTYNSYEITPDVTVIDGSKTLVANEDYYLTYENNINAGTANVTVTGMGDYCGSKNMSFTINPVQSSELKISGVTDEEYGAYEIEPWIRVTFGDITLYEGEDYTVSYRNNYYPGTAYIDVNFKGNYAGKRTISFIIYLEAVTELKAEAYSSSEVDLHWTDWSWNVDCYYVYRYDRNAGKYVYIGKSSYGYYYDRDLNQYENYKYMVVPVVFDSSKKAITGYAAYVSCQTLLKAPVLELTTLAKSVEIKYKKNSKADGYDIYRQRLDKNSDMKSIKTIGSNAAGSYTDEGISKSGTYEYCIRAYKLVNGQKIYGEYGDGYCTDDVDAVLRGANLKSKTSFKVYNKQGKSTTSYTYTLSKNDIKLLKKFADKHFKKGMSEVEKLSTTLYWLNENITYALGSDWDKISGKSWVEAAFKYKLGQCAQYNGAMAAMMVYLGYDAYVIQSYRGSYPNNYWQHFWCEVKIQGRKYLMETGNSGRSGPWSYFLTPYTHTSGYVINQLPADIAEAETVVSSVKLSKTKYTYNGKAKKPKVTVKNNKGKTLTEGKDYTVKYASGRKKVGKYTVTVKFKGSYSGTKKLTFSIVPKSTSISSLKAGKKKLTVKLKKQTTQTTGYQIEYSTSSKMKNSKKVTVSKNSTTKKTIKNLKSSKKYYVRIRTYKTVKINGKSTKIYSSWSKVKNVKVK